MRLLLATRQTQGQRDNDFCHATEGELVTLALFCCTGATVDDACGCKRSFCGLGSHRATTTAVVSELPIEPAVFRAAIRASLEAGGWAVLLNPPALLDEAADHLATTVERAAVDLEPGTVVEMRGDILPR